MDGYFGKGHSGMEFGSSGSHGYWPAGAGKCGATDLPWLLLGSARDNALRAVGMYESSSRLQLLQAAVSVGAAVEQAAKACVADIEPALLAEKGQVEAVLWLTGHKDLAKKPAIEIRTITGVDAAMIARERRPNVVAPHDQVLSAMNVRNAATHMAFVDQASLRDEVSTMVRIVDSIVLALGEDRTQFWADSLPLIDELIHQRLSAVARIVAAKREAALRRVRGLIKGLGDELGSLILAARSHRSWSSDHDEPIECPVCSQQAWLQCGVEESDPIADGEGGLYVERTAFPFSFECSVCGFQLEGSDELAELSLDHDIELEARDVDESDYDPPDRTADI